MRIATKSLYDELQHGNQRVRIYAVSYQPKEAGWLVEVNTAGKVREFATYAPLTYLVSEQIRELGDILHPELRRVIAEAHSWTGLDTYDTLKEDAAASESA